MMTKSSDFFLVLSLLVVVSPVFALAALPTSWSTQLGVGLVALAVIAISKPFAHHRVARFVILGAGGFVVLRYAFWRTMETIPWETHGVALTLALLLYAVEMFAIGFFFLTSFVVADPINRARPNPIKTVAEVPTVDIFVPSYNEPASMLAITLAAATSLRYPAHKLTVYLCDDGGTDQRCNDPDPEKAAAAIERRVQLQGLCRKLGATYLTRAQNTSAKAGNLSAAFARSDSDLIVVFDADHVPTNDFLERTVGYFVQDPRLFLVQTPHYFLNYDPVEKNIGVMNKIPPENEMFYSVIQKGLDKWNASFFCGSGAVMRRVALQENNGFSGESITEDAETALALHARGWKSMYVDRAMLAGLQPETVTSFIAQRSRWAQGMTQIFLLKNPLLQPGLSIAQRLCYTSSSAFWFFPLIRLTFLMAPLIYLFTGFDIYVATVEQFMSYTVIYLAAVLLLQNAMFRKVRWPLISEVYETVLTPYLWRVILSTIRKPRAPTFKVTAKDETLDEDYLAPIASSIFILAGLLAVGVVVALWRWSAFPGDRAIVALVGGWCFFNLLLVVTASGAMCERRQRRRAPRVDLDGAADLILPTGEIISGRLIDISMTGLQVRIPYSDAATRLTAGKEVRIVPAAPRNDARRAIDSVVANVASDGGVIRLGLSFPEEQSAESLRMIARVMFSDSERWHKRRTAILKGPGLLAGLAFFLYFIVVNSTQTLTFIVQQAKRSRSTATTKGDKSVFDAPALPGLDLEPEPAYAGQAGGGQYGGGQYGGWAAQSEGLSPAARHHDPGAPSELDDTQPLRPSVVQPHRRSQPEFTVHDRSAS